VEEGLGAYPTVQTVERFAIELAVLSVHVKNAMQKLAIGKKFHPGVTFQAGLHSHPIHHMELVF
jgi:hypothetical protein